jgi:hypothetical protein
MAVQFLAFGADAETAERSALRGEKGGEKSNHQQNVRKM